MKTESGKITAFEERKEKIKNLDNLIDKLQKEKSREEGLVALAENVYESCKRKVPELKAEAISLIIDTIDYINQNGIYEEKTNFGNDLEEDLEAGVSKLKSNLYLASIRIKTKNKPRTEKTVNIGQYKSAKEAVAAKRAAVKIALKLGFDARPLVKSSPSTNRLQILDVKNFRRINQDDLQKMLEEPISEDIAFFENKIEHLANVDNWRITHAGQNRSMSSCQDLLTNTLPVLRKDYLNKNRFLYRKFLICSLKETSHVVISIEKQDEEVAILTMFGLFYTMTSASSWILDRRTNDARDRDSKILEAVYDRRKSARH